MRTGGSTPGGIEDTKTNDDKAPGDEENLGRSARILQAPPTEAAAKFWTPYLDQPEGAGTTCRHADASERDVLHD